MRSQLVKVALTPEEYGQLEQWAFAEDREASQHARYLIKRALTQRPDVLTASCEPAAAA
jgi:hypothetical protein